MDIWFLHYTLADNTIFKV